MVHNGIIYGIILIVKQNLPMTTSLKITSDQKLKKWLDSMPTDCGYELTGFKHGEYYGESQLKLFLTKK